MLSCLVWEGQNSNTDSYLLRAPFPLLVVTLAAALLALFTSFVAESDLCLPLSENEKKTHMQNISTGFRHYLLFQRHIKVEKLSIAGKEFNQTC